ncbi:putative glycosyltransferase [Sesamum angolense]|uniref:Glycosyltransferase n=1 Tax=Sesamum angolense TaxID=2727404 RepID=A0AAE1W8F2_9LAMI|nr:putative glycosyltransferase [Sesamum angolense]
MKSGAGSGSGGVVCTSFSIVLISAVFAASIAFVFLIGYFSHGLPSSFYSPSQPQFHIPIVELLSHTRPAPDQSRAVLSSEFSSKFKPPVTRRAENKLEQGLARARAAILKAASATNSSIIINNEILSPAIYWNPSAFYQGLRPHKEMHFSITHQCVSCNANSSEGFDPTKDVSLPEIHLYGGIVNRKLISPPPSTICRPNLAFFAGGIHGPIRPILLKHWRGKDTDLHVYEYLPKDQDYYDSMLRSKFCYALVDTKWLAQNC